MLYVKKLFPDAVDVTQVYADDKKGLSFKIQSPTYKLTISKKAITAIENEFGEGFVVEVNIVSVSNEKVLEVLILEGVDQEPKDVDESSD